MCLKVFILPCPIITLRTVLAKCFQQVRQAGQGEDLCGGPRPHRPVLLRRACQAGPPRATHSQLLRVLREAEGRGSSAAAGALHQVVVHPNLNKLIKVVRWQSFIPSLDCGHNPKKGRDQILQRSVAEP